MRRDDDHPDIYVTIRRTFKKEYTVYGPYDYWAPYGWGPYGWGSYTWGWGYVGGPWYTYETIIGALTVDFENAATGELLWRGIAEATVHPHASPHDRTEKVGREVSKIFKHFPPIRVAAVPANSDVAAGPR
jgi:hypothetical protein